MSGNPDSHSKEGILFRLAEAAVDHPDETVRAALLPVVGERTLRELIAEAKANANIFAARVRTSLRHSYSNHYRRMLPPLLAALSFRCNNTAYRPVMDALDLLARYAEVDGKVRFYAAGEQVSLDEVVPKAWEQAVVDERRRLQRDPREDAVHARPHRPVRPVRWSDLHRRRRHARQAIP